MGIILGILAFIGNMFLIALVTAYFANKDMR